ncbi:CPBP family intramembrane glutamic endopeptidase [Nocardioides flavescens]|uniref:CPBP family intramembrane glutamic endopeptidase n=1 Tax=Nocardioides flavescens TaxID=2691959 RepID=UPI00301E2F33
MSAGVGPGPEGPGLEYHLLQRARRWSWWRPLVGVLTLGILTQFIALIVLMVAFTVGFVVLGGGGSVGDFLSSLADTDDVSPLSLAFLNALWALAIPCVLLTAFALHGMRPGWVASVAGRPRWRWMATCFGLALVALVATLLVSALLPAQSGDPQITGQVNDWTSTTRDFVLVVLLLTPLQAAGEEYAFRGYLTQAFGGLLRSRWAAVLVPALIFALAHGAQDPPVFVDRFAFGLVAGVLVITTGGLEAGIAMHVLNNFLAFGLALAFSDMSSALNPTGGTWWSLPTTVTQSVVYLVLATWAARRAGIATRTVPEAGGRGGQAGAELEPARPPV